MKFVYYNLTDYTIPYNAENSDEKSPVSNLLRRLCLAWLGFQFNSNRRKIQVSRHTSPALDPGHHAYVRSQSASPRPRGAKGSSKSSSYASGRGFHTTTIVIISAILSSARVLFRVIREEISRVAEQGSVCGIDGQVAESAQSVCLV